jgi:hypothetical protein
VLALARAQICHLYQVALYQDVLGLYVAVEDTLAVHELQRPEYLEHVKLYLLKRQRVLLVLQSLIQIHLHQFKHQCQFPLVNYLDYLMVRRTMPQSS